MLSIPSHQPDGIHPSRFLCGYEQYVHMYRMFSFLRQKRRQNLLVSFALLFNSDLLKVNPNNSSSFFVDCLLVFHRLYCNLRFDLFFSFLLLFSLLPFVLFFSVFCFPSLPTFSLPSISPRPCKYSPTKIPLSFRPHCRPHGGRQLERGISRDTHCQKLF